MITPLSIAEVLSAVAQLASAFAIAGGVWVAHSQLTAWRQERRAVRQSEVAEELIALGFSVQDSFRAIRNPIDRVTIDEAKDPTSGYRRRYERLAEANDLFQKLRAAQIRVRAVIGDEEVEAAVEELFSARSELAVSIEEAIEAKSSGSPSVSDRERAVELRRVIFASFGDKDLLGKRISVAVDTIEARLTPCARLSDARPARNPRK
jgi:hypothetical protein